MGCEFDSPYSMLATLGQGGRNTLICLDVLIAEAQIKVNQGSKPLELAKGHTQHSVWGRWHGADSPPATRAACIPSSSQLSVLDSQRQLMPFQGTIYKCPAL